MTDEEYVSISEAARRIGISRPRLSSLIKEKGDIFGIEKKVSGNRILVPFVKVSDLLQRQAIDRKVRTPKTVRKVIRTDNEMWTYLREQNQQLVSENRELKIENKQLQEEIKALLKGENKGIISRWVRTISEVRKGVFENSRPL